MDTAKTLLVVEDDLEVRQMLDQILRFSGYDVTTAQNGVEALAAIEKQRPGLIVTDILMPKMDGFGLIYRLRTDAKTQNIPVVFLTATYVAADDKDFAGAMGATRFLQKPVDTRDLLEMIVELLNQPEADAPTPVKETEFFEKYQALLEAKLADAKAQIARAEQVLGPLPAGEKPNLEAVLRQSQQDLQTIEAELKQVREYVGQRTKQ
jgi:CheY-like chemotaxis protein